MSPIECVCMADFRLVFVCLYLSDILSDTIKSWLGRIEWAWHTHLQTRSVTNVRVSNTYYCYVVRSCITLELKSTHAHLHSLSRPSISNYQTIRNLISTFPSFQAKVTVWTCLFKDSGSESIPLFITMFHFSLSSFVLWAWIKKGYIIKVAT